MNLFRKFSLLLLVVLSTQVSADNPLPIIDWQKRQTVESRLTAYGDDLLGDSIDRHLGSLVFEHTDVMIPGNSHLDVSVRRRLSSGYNYDEQVNVDFADWELVVPRMTVVALKSHGWKGRRCSGKWKDSLPDASFTTVTTPYANRVGTRVQFDHTSYSNGLSMDIPGQGSQSVLKTDGTSIYPGMASTVNEWYFTCTRASDGGEGFIGHAPNGDQYFFTRVIERPYKRMGFAKRGPTSKHRLKVHLVATEVRDVNNNWVKYNYDSQNRLTRIQSNDGRSINLSYSQQLITSVTANNKTWRYQYRDSRYKKKDWDVNTFGTPFSPFRSKVLSRVTLPDNNFWSFNLDGMQAEPSPPSRSCDRIGTAVSLTHPHGVKGTFQIEDLQHRQAWKYVTNVAEDCFQSATLEPQHAGTSLPSGYSGPSNRQDPFELLSARTMSVVSKTLSAPSIENATWTFEYEQEDPCTGLPAAACRTRIYSNWNTPLNLSPYVKKTPSFDYVIKQKIAGKAYQSDQAYAGHNPMDFTNWTKVTQPNGSVVTHYHLWRHEEGFGGKEIRRTISKNNKVLDQHDMVYTQHSCNGKTAVFPGAHQGAGHCPTFVTKTVQQRDGDTFTSTSAFNLDPASTAFSFGKPVATSTWSNISKTPRTSVFEYQHLTQPWIKGLLTNKASNGRQEKAFDYNHLGQLTAVYEYGRSDASMRYAYHADGNIKAFTDANQHRTSFADYYRGLPQTMTRADGNSEFRKVDTNGLVQQTTDGNGNTTGYRYDIMGRLNKITPPGGFDETTINYQFAGDGVTQTINKGLSRNTVTYDAMFRPTLEQTQAIDTGWTTYTNTRFDNAGQKIFKSQPSANAQETKGVDYRYDGLGRIFSEKENVAPYAETKHRYYKGHAHRIIDPAGNFLQYYSYGYDGPGNTDYRAIYESDNGKWLRKTFVAKNVWGELYRLYQWGDAGGKVTAYNHYFYYDDHRRLCRKYVPEQGATKYEYDPSGQLTAYAEGTSNTGCTVPQNTARVDLTYDQLGRLENTIFHHSKTPDISRTYDDNGNLQSINRGGINWRYDYNELNMPTSEQLKVDGLSFDLGYQYNTSGHMTQKTLPAGSEINYTPDGLGRITNVGVANGSSYTNLAAGVDYHASGAVAGFDYGNGQIFTQTLNNRLLPHRVRSIKGNQKALDQTLAYDSRGNITSIIDGAVSGNNRTYGYDGLKQLVTAQGPWGSGKFTYDGTGNMLTKTLGSRTVSMYYNDRNRLGTAVDSGATGTRYLNYDARGNVTALGGLIFTYDRSNQPTSMFGAAGNNNTVSSTYQYDGNLKRVKSVVDNQTIYNVYDQSGSLVHVDINDTNDDKDAIVDYVSGPMGSLARIKNGDITYLHPDHLGSAQSGTNASGNIAWREKYTPYGEELNGPSANDNLAGFTGHIKDKATGLNYMQARYYDPVIGRFLSIDPQTFMDTGHSGMVNRYSYTYNNPTNMVDPSGELPSAIVGAAIGGFAAGIAAKIAGASWTDAGLAAAGGAMVGAATSGFGVAQYVAGVSSSYGASVATAAVVGTVTTSAVSGATGNALGQLTGMGIDAALGNEIAEFDAGQMLLAAGLAAVGSTVPAIVAGTDAALGSTVSTGFVGDAALAINSALVEGAGAKVVEYSEGNSAAWKEFADLFE